MEFSFQIGPNKWEVPNELDAQTFQSAMAWDIEDAKNLKPFVSAISNCPIKELNLLDDDTFNLIFAYCVSLLPADETLNKQNGVYALKDFDAFTLGDFVDIDLYIADGLTKHVVDLVTKLYDMPIGTAAHISIKRVWAALVAVAKWRELVYKEHDEFFEIKGNQDANEKIEIHNIQLMWYEAILMLADHQFLNIGLVTARPYKEALNFLTWKKNEIAKQQLEQVKRKYDLQKRSR
jgi:hypothetical protein